jgi:hypothetical protein
VQIAESLVGRRHVDALHVISHGGPDLLAFGPARVTAANLGAYAAKLAVIRGALSAEANILLHSCNASARGFRAGSVAIRPGLSGRAKAQYADVLAVVDELVNLSVGDASGGITYDHVGYDGAMPYDTLTFGSAFSIVDTIVITVASGRAWTSTTSMPRRRSTSPQPRPERRRCLCQLRRGNPPGPRHHERRIDRAGCAVLGHRRHR